MKIEHQILPRDEMRFEICPLKGKPNRKIGRQFELWSDKRGRVCGLIIKDYEELLDEFRSILSMNRSRERLADAIVSETSLKKDWLKPEEDNAWRNL
ncbi:MAG: hypothetical protein HY762_09060 [Planctomycetes bacterium]|nr:hypothetical protein [Planctomycetota bacterium]